MDWFIGHLLGDWIFQNDWMALNKKEKTFPLMIHCLLYTCIIMTLTGWYHHIFKGYVFAIIYLSHYILDGSFILQYPLRWQRQAFLKEPMFPWSWIVVDNSLHLIVLYLIERFLI